jgi:hypothetical protein
MCALTGTSSAAATLVTEVRYCSTSKLDILAPASSGGLGGAGEYAEVAELEVAIWARIYTDTLRS